MGPAEGRRHDIYMLGESNPRQRLRLENQEWGNDYCLYGEKGHPLSDEIQIPFRGSILTPEQIFFEKDMTDVRISVEYGFIKVTVLSLYRRYNLQQGFYDIRWVL